MSPPSATFSRARHIAKILYSLNLSRRMHTTWVTCLTQSAMRLRIYEDLCPWENFIRTVLTNIWPESILKEKNIGKKTFENTGWFLDLWCTKHSCAKCKSLQIEEWGTSPEQFSFSDLLRKPFSWIFWDQTQDILECLCSQSWYLQRKSRTTYFIGLTIVIFR